MASRQDARTHKSQPPEDPNTRLRGREEEWQGERGQKVSAEEEKAAEAERTRQDATPTTRPKNAPLYESPARRRRQQKEREGEEGQRAEGGGPR